MVLAPVFPFLCSYCDERLVESCTKKVTKYMQNYTHCWPTEDYYFRSGTYALTEQLQGPGCHIPYYFVRLDGHTLISFQEHPPLQDGQDIVIIASPHLMPLTAFWLAEK